MAHTNDWWKRTSALDDALDADVIDEGDDDNWLDDFDFSDYRDDRVGSAVDSIWGRYASKGSLDTAERLNAARKLAQGFVDTFATGDKRYDVTFDQAIGTAGTDFDQRKVWISHKPLFDPTLDTSQANTIITAMAAHEASHVRYGKSTYAGVKREFGAYDKRAAMISNWLDDVRIERRFASDFPGYADVFEPALAYVAQAAGANPAAKQMTPSSRAIAAVRYGKHVDFTGHEVERDAWQAWADQYTATDRVVDHVKGVRVGLEMLREFEQQEREQPKPVAPKPVDQPEGPTTDGPTTPTNDTNDDQPAPSQPTSNDDTSDDTDEGPMIELPSCPADPKGIDQTADANGQSDMTSSREAQELANDVDVLTQPDANGTRGEIYWTPKGIAKSRKAIHGTIASGAIRNAFTKSRRGHFATQGGQQTGRLHNRSITRITSDHHVFAKRTAPSETKYRVWLLIDCSGSMGVDVMTAGLVARTIAAATRQLPNVALDVWGWTDGFRLGQFSATRVWTTGRDLADIGYIGSIRQGGTPDLEVITWAAKAIRENLRADEQPMLIIASDGSGSLRSQDDGGKATIDGIRRSGVEVMSVAIGSSVDQTAYGKAFIPWQGSIKAMAAPIGKAIARTIGG